MTKVTLQVSPGTDFYIGDKQYSIVKVGQVTVDFGDTLGE